MKIKNIKAKQIKDSRGEPTLWVGVVSENGAKGWASVPSGKSRGWREAVEKRDANLGVQGNIDLIKNKIEPELIGIEAVKQGVIDEILIELDNSENKENLGSNTMLGISLACARLGASLKNMNLADYLSRLGGWFNKKTSNIALFCNMIEGGSHAQNDLTWQEYLIIVQEKTIAQSLQLAQKFYQDLGNLLADKFSKNLSLADENGYAWPNTSSNYLKSLWNSLLGKEQIKEEEPVQVLYDLIKGQDSFSNIHLGLDIAGNDFFDPETKQYCLVEKKYSRKDYLDLLINIIEKYDLLAIEDPFVETDIDYFHLLNKKIKKLLVVGDDLTVSRADLIKNAGEEKAVGGVIIKPNQIGTLSETIIAINKAYEQKLKVIISHRSGETKDDFIADLAFACRAYGLKSGAPLGQERLAKYKRLVELESCIFP